jgi:deoxyhypusine synthase
MNDNYKVTEETLYKIAEAVVEINKAVAAAEAAREAAREAAAESAAVYEHNDAVCPLLSVRSFLQQAVLHAVLAQKAIKHARRNEKNVE